MAADAQPRPSVPEDAYQLGLRLAARGDLIGAEAALRRAHEQGHPAAVRSLGRLGKKVAGGHQSAMGVH